MLAGQLARDPGATRESAFSSSKAGLGNAPWMTLMCVTEGEGRTSPPAAVKGFVRIDCAGEQVRGGQVAPGSLRAGRWPPGRHGAGRQAPGAVPWDSPQAFGVGVGLRRRVCPAVNAGGPAGPSLPFLASSSNYFVVVVVVSDILFGFGHGPKQVRHG